MSQPEKLPPPIPRELPEGYHAGLLTAITVLLGFSLTFLRFWSVEKGSGPWTTGGKVAAGVIGVGILAQLIALFNALSLKDQEQRHYQWTIRWFRMGVVIVIAGLLVAIYVAA